MSFLIKHKPIPLSLRHTCLVNKKTLWKGKCIKNLSLKISSNKYLDNRGRKIIRTRGKILKKRYRLIDYRNIFFGVPGKIVRIEYNPYKTSFISLVVYLNGLICYINTIEGILEGSIVTSHIKKLKNLNFFIRKGDTLILKIASPGWIISNIEKYTGFGPCYIRSAGTFGKLIRKTYKDAFILLPTGKQIKVSIWNKVILGINSNNSARGLYLGKAGRSIWRGKKSLVRGVAKNPIDHPHGGGEGKKSKKCDPMTSWGKVYKWRKTTN